MSLLLVLFLAVLPPPLQEANAQLTSAGGGQTKENISGWTVDTLKAHYDQVIAEMDKRFEQRFQAQEIASVKQASNQNEFRGSLNDLSATRLGKTEYDVAHKALENALTASNKTLSDKIESVEKHSIASMGVIQSRLDIREGSAAGVNNFVWLVIGVITVIVVVLGYILSTRKTSGKSVN